MKASSEQSALSLFAADQKRKKNSKDYKKNSGRVKAMKNVKNVKNTKNTKKDNSSNKVIGVNEIRDFLKNKLDLDEVKELISIKTRQYAKRQSTWARGQMQDWNKLDPKDINKFLKKI